MDKLREKRCGGCKETKPVSAFSRNRAKKDGLQSECKECKSKAYSKRYYKDIEATRKRWREYYRTHPNTERVKNWRKQGINLTIEEYNKMFDEQKGCCAICGRHQSELKRKLVPDHNHKTGQNRGLLCQQCNLMIANADECEAVLKQAAKYLAFWNKE